MLKLIKKIAAVCGLALAAAALLCGCSSDHESNGKLRLTFQIWDDAQRGGMQDIADAYMARHPEVSIEVQVTSWDEYWTKLDAAAESNQLPDIFWMHTNQILLYADSGMLADVTDLYDDDTYSHYSDISIANTQGSDGRMYGVPKDKDTVCLVYNKEMFDQAGVAYPDENWTWDDLTEASQKIYDATGITLSSNQHAHVTKLIQEKGLGDRVRVELLDYRKLDETAPYDKIASVGMFEHVGRAQLEGYFAKLRRLLKPGGLIMNHGITAAGVYNAELGSGMGEFIEKYIFPGGELTHISVVMEAMTNGGLEEVDVENLRPHYARTLWAWSDALEAHLAEAARILGGEQGERSLRAYRLYLAGCAMGFEHGWIALHQIVGQHPATGRPDELDNPPDLAYPWRRDYMYRDPDPKA